MSERYEKARAIAEAAANRWNAFGDTAGINWLADAIMGLPAEKPFDPDPAFEPCDCKIGDCKRITRRCLLEDADDQPR